ncbi:unnamed protein product [Lactuca saligna]|uniref:Uncharacterized protein n=1 Tax=Lactuca saligna TaxID=75948 RepID=A0AA35YV16_LACSI|nr:unnamed protein product [Lactuca saligna]
MFLIFFRHLLTASTFQLPSTASDPRFWTIFLSTNNNKTKGILYLHFFSEDGPPFKLEADLFFSWRRSPTVHPHRYRRFLALVDQSPWDQYVNQRESNLLSSFHNLEITRKSGKGKRPRKVGNRFWKSVGLQFKDTKRSYQRKED